MMKHINHRHLRISRGNQPVQPPPDDSIENQTKLRTVSPSTTSSSHRTPSKQRQVTFANYSSMCVYDLDHKYESNKSYTSTERKVFRRNAAKDGRHVHDLIAKHSTHDSKDAHALNQLLEAKTLEIENLLGIEHLVHEKGCKRLTKQRRFHCALLLCKQKELLKENVRNESVLAAAVQLTSAKSMKKARLRAALAA